MFICHKNQVSINTNRSAFGLIEVMISAMILSISLLGIASIQSKALNIIIEASKKETAYRMIGQINNFVSTTDKSLVGNMVAKNPATDVASCYASIATTNCDQQKFYQTMITEWNDILSKILPGGKGCTCASPNPDITKPTTLRSAIKWTTLSGTTSVVCFDNQILSSTINSSNSNICPSGAPADVCSSGTLITNSSTV